jgi:hypothetical protein
VKGREHNIDFEEFSPNNVASFEKIYFTEAAF